MDLARSNTTQMTGHVKPVMPNSNARNILQDISGQSIRQTNHSNVTDAVESSPGQITGRNTVVIASSGVSIRLALRVLRIVSVHSYTIRSARFRVRQNCNLILDLRSQMDMHKVPVCWLSNLAVDVELY